MELQEAIERFLSDTERRRSDVTVKRYGEAMELLQSYLALELIDPDAQGEAPAGGVGDVTAEAISAFINDFLGNRLMSNDRARKRYVAATRSFVQWLAKTDLLSEEVVGEILEVLRRAAKGFAPGPDSGESTDVPRASGLSVVGSGRSGGGEVRYFQILDATEKQLTLLDLESAEEVRGDSPSDEGVEPGDLVAGVLTGRGSKARVTGVRLIASEDEVDDDDFPLDDWDEDWEDDWELSSGPAVEDALEILASEDRYAPREVVRVVLTDIDAARDDLLDWLSDDDYRNEPFPGAGEAPANAARLLSEVRDEDALPRLLSVLGATDPLGEEAPLAVARYGLAVAGSLVELIRDEKLPLVRRAAALWSLAFLTALNPALRTLLMEEVVRVLPGAEGELRSEAIDVVEELRLSEVCSTLLEMSARGELDFEALDRTAELFEGRVRAEGWGERIGEVMLPVLYLYPTSEEIEEFYESLEEDLGDLWDLMGVDEDGDGDDDDDDDGDEDDGEDGEEDGDEPSDGGKVIPFRRPPE
jgi:hypothetical protein